MKVCKYLLPCGKCDKFGTHCNLTVEDFEMFNCHQSKECKEEECEHEWVLDKTNVGLVNATYHYVCSKCGKVKILGLGV